jgi:glutamate dehydrogenase
MQLQGAIEATEMASDPTMSGELLAAFPRPMQERFGTAIEQHRLRREIIATKVANRIVNRLGIVAPFSLVEEEGAAFGQMAMAFVAAERLFGMADLWRALDSEEMPEQVRLELFDQASIGLQLQIADILRCTSPNLLPGQIVELLQPGLGKLNAELQDLLRPEPRADAAGVRARLIRIGGPPALVDRIVRLQELNGAVGLAMLGQRLGQDEIALTKAYTRLGEALALDWAQNSANQFAARDQWERLLTAGLARDFEELRLAFLDRRGGGDPVAAVETWVGEQAPRIDQFRRTVERARTAPVTTAPMLAQIATQARVLLAR